MTSFAARDGLDVIDEEAVMKCWNEAQEHLKRETRGKDKDYLFTKINLKKKRYNKAKDTAINLVKDLKENSLPISPITGNKNLL